MLSDEWWFSTDAPDVTIETVTTHADVHRLLGRCFCVFVVGVIFFWGGGVLFLVFNSLEIVARGQPLLPW